MGDFLRTGKPSRYITNAEINSAFHLCGVGTCIIEHWLGLWRGAFICVGWQVTLCDPIWQVTLRSSELDFL